MSLLVVGSVALDDIETPRGKAERVLGGAASYAAVAAARYTQPQLVGIVGEDFPKEHIALFQSAGVGILGLDVQPGTTFHWAGRYHKDLVHRDTLLTDLGVFENWSPTIPDTMRQMPYLFLGNIHPRLQLEVLEQMNGARLVGCDTMNLWINISRDELLRVIEKVDILLINDEEARMLTGEVSLPKAAKVLRQMGPEIIIIKRGEHGASVHTRQRVFFAPAYPIDDVVDPTGAGDTFAGALMGYLAQQDTIGFDAVCRGVVHGTVMASFIVEEFSLSGFARASTDEFDKRLKFMADMVRF